MSNNSFALCTTTPDDIEAGIDDAILFFKRNGEPLNLPSDEPLLVPHTTVGNASEEMRVIFSLFQRTCEEYVKLLEESGSTKSSIPAEEAAHYAEALMHRLLKEIYLDYPKTRGRHVSLNPNWDVVICDFSNSRVHVTHMGPVVTTRIIFPPSIDPCSTSHS